MLPLSSILSQLSVMQQLLVEKSLQAQQGFNSKSLLIFNLLAEGQTKEEILQDGLVDEESYFSFERPIYNCILKLFDLTPSTTRDHFVAEVSYSIHDQSYKNDQEKGRFLENLFHQMKRYSIEQDSALLLKELYRLNEGNPLQAVYQHLYLKYDTIAKINAEIFDIFNQLNTQLSSFLIDSETTIEMKELIGHYKAIRNLHRRAENRTSQTVLDVTMLLLSTYCGQTQLLKEQSKSMNQLFIDCKTQIQELPFGLERYFLTNIFRQTAKYSIECLELTLNSEAVLFPIETSTTKAPNFSFNLDQLNNQDKKIDKNKVINDFTQRFTAFSIPQDSFSIRPNQI